MLAVYKKELKGYFCNLSGYIFAAFLLVMTGIYFTAITLTQGYTEFEYTLQGVNFIFMLIVPIVTMKCFAEERHSHTDQLLYSLPVSLPKIVLGKYFALCTVMVVPMIPMSFMPLIISGYAGQSGASVNFASAYGGLLGFFLLGCAFLAIGMLISSLTESQVVAAVMTIGTLLILYLMSSLSGLIPSTAAASFAALTVIVIAFSALVYYLTKNIYASLGAGVVLEGANIVCYTQFGTAYEGLIQKVLNWVSLYDRYSNFNLGLLDLTAVVYYLSITALCVFITVQVVEKRRWS